MARIPSALVAFLETGRVLVMGTRDASLIPEALDVMGLRVHADRDHVTTFVPRAVGARTLANIEATRDVAIVAEQPITHRSYQLKGRMVALREANEADRELIESYILELAREFEIVGIPRRLSLRFNRWPAVAVDVRVRDIFDQTPGPVAGKPFAGGV
jgi:hypothetical protein